MSAPFTGVAVALVTLFDDNLEVDLGATSELAATLVDGGVAAVVTAGSTGEAGSLTPEERIDLIRAVKRAVPSTPVLAGTGAAWSGAAAALTAQARDAGADAALVLSPLGASDPRRYYDAICKAVPDLPLLAYHYPAISGPGIALDYLPDLPVAGIKDSSGDADRLLAEVATWGRPTYTGSSALVHLAGRIGCPGAILALANAEPALCVAAFNGDAEAQKQLYPAHVAQKGNFPHAIKQLTAKAHGTSVASRMG